MANPMARERYRRDRDGLGSLRSHGERFIMLDVGNMEMKA
jgi:hypothetical protein